MLLYLRLAACRLDWSLLGQQIMQLKALNMYPTDKDSFGNKTLIWNLKIIFRERSETTTQ